MAGVIVLGGGMVGSVMAADLAADGFDVAIADVRPESLRKSAQLVKQLHGVDIRSIEADLGDAHVVKRTVEPFDMVCGALASAIGFQAMQAVIEAGKHYVDISFMPEDALTLHDSARQQGVTIVPDCGVAPGMSNMLAGAGHAQLDECISIEIYVGGLPVQRSWPFQYKAGFSPHDVIEEYTRPARLVEHGEVVVRDALSEVELLEFDGLGTVEAFNTDGLRSLVHTLDAPMMKEKTIRYPGHAELMRVLREIGLFSRNPIDVNGTDVRPIDLTSALMFPQWQYNPGEADMTIMRVIVRGVQAGAARTLSWELIDRFDDVSQCTSMSRTTALPCTIVARMIMDGALDERGVIPPERIGAQPAMLEHVLAELGKRGIRFRK